MMLPAFSACVVNLMAMMSWSWSLSSLAVRGVGGDSNSKLLLYLFSKFKRRLVICPRVRNSSSHSWSFLS